MVPSFERFRQVPWSEVVSNIANMTEKMDNFASRCKKLPGRLKQWDAFTQLRLGDVGHESPYRITISDMELSIPSTIEYIVF